MKCPSRSSTLILLCVLSGGTVFAGQAGGLPDLGGAMQRPMDGHVVAVSTANAAIAETTRSEEHPVEHRASRTDEPGWKPYHSAL